MDSNSKVFSYCGDVAPSRVKEVKDLPTRHEAEQIRQDKSASALDGDNLSDITSEDEKGQQGVTRGNEPTWQIGPNIRKSSYIILNIYT